LESAFESVTPGGVGCNLGHKPPRSQTGSLRVEGSEGGGS